MITIKDIAKKAGVSHTTVSRALNSNPVIPERTAAKIRQIAEEMGYMRSAAAQGLRGGPTNVAGVLVSRLDDPYFGDILQGIEEKLAEKGYVLLINSSDFDPKKEQNAFRAFLERRVDGLIISSIDFNEEKEAYLRRYNLPVVVINNQAINILPNSVSHDDFYGATAVTQSLIRSGCWRIAYIGNASAGRTNRDRFAGYRAELESAGLKVEDGLVAAVEGGDILSGKSGMETLLERGMDPDAVFCFNDMMAIGALQVLKERGLRVPQQIGVAGFDNIPYSSFTNPVLTTFDQPKKELGWLAAETLLKLIDSAQKQKVVPRLEPQYLRGKLLVRESTRAS